MNTKSNSNRCNASISGGQNQFCRKLGTALGRLKGKLQEQFEQAYPGRSQLIRQAVAEAEELAWETSFPHLLLPDFAEARLAEILAAPEPAYARAA